MYFFTDVVTRIVIIKFLYFLFNRVTVRTTEKIIVKFVHFNLIRKQLRLTLNLVLLIL
jgi:hypothetical protein